MAYLVDGNNVLGLRPEIVQKDPGSRSRLVQRLAELSRLKRTKVIVVFDGEPEPGAAGSEMSLGDVRVIYTGRTTDADSRILKILEQAKDPAGFILVTSDRALADRARHRRVRQVVPSLRFRRMLDDMAPEGASAQGPLSAAEVSDWEEWFKQKS